MAAWAPVTPTSSCRCAASRDSSRRAGCTRRPAKGPSQVQASYAWSVTIGRFDRITVDPDVLGGKPCVRGLRISVGMIVQMVAAGKSVQQIVVEYPYLEAADVQQALEYSAALAESEYHLALRPSA